MEFDAPGGDDTGSDLRDPGVQPVHPVRGHPLRDGYNLSAETAGMPDSLKIHCEDGRVLEVPGESVEKLLFLTQTMNSPDAFKSPAFAQLRRDLSQGPGPDPGAG